MTLCCLNVKLTPGRATQSVLVRTIKERPFGGRSGSWNQGTRCALHRYSATHRPAIVRFASRARGATRKNACNIRKTAGILDSGSFAASATRKISTGMVVSQRTTTVPYRVFSNHSRVPTLQPRFWGHHRNYVCSSNDYVARIVRR